MPDGFLSSWIILYLRNYHRYNKHYTLKPRCDRSQIEVVDLNSEQVLLAVSTQQWTGFKFVSLNWVNLSRLHSKYIAPLKGSLSLSQLSQFSWMTLTHFYVSSLNVYFSLAISGRLFSVSISPIHGKSFSVFDSF